MPTFTLLSSVPASIVLRIICEKTPAMLAILFTSSSSVAETRSSSILIYPIVADCYGERSSDGDFCLRSVLFKPFESRRARTFYLSGSSLCCLSL